MHLCIFQIYEKTFCCFFHVSDDVQMTVCAKHCAIMTVFLTWLNEESHNKWMQHQLRQFIKLNRNTSVNFFDLFPDFLLAVSTSFPPYRFPLNLERGQSRSRGRKRHKHGLEVRFPTLTGQLNLLWLMLISPRSEIVTIPWVYWYCWFIFNLNHMARVVPLHFSFGYISGVFTLWPK